MIGERATVAGRALALGIALLALGLAPSAASAAAAFGYLGSFGGHGTGPGEFGDPRGIAFDSRGEVWVADELGGRLEIFTADGRYLRTFGTRFVAPVAIGFDRQQNMYVAEPGSNDVQKFGPDGAFMTKWGTGPGFGNDKFFFDDNLAVTPDGTVYVANLGDSSVRKYDSNGGLLGFWTGFAEPLGVATHAAGDVYVANGLANQIVKLSSTGAVLNSWGSPGLGPGQFLGPAGVAVGPDGDVYVVDYLGGRLQKFTPNGGFLGEWGGTGVGGVLGLGGDRTLGPWGIAVDCHSNVYVSEMLGGRVDIYGERSTLGSPCVAPARPTRHTSVCRPGHRASQPAGNCIRTRRPHHQPRSAT